MNNNPLNEAKKRVAEITNLLIAGVGIALFIGIAASTISSFACNLCIRLLMIIISILIAIFFILRFYKKVIEIQHASQTIVTAIVYDNTTKNILLPKTLKMNPTLAVNVDPFPIALLRTYNTIRSYKGIPDQDISHIVIIITLLAALARKLTFYDGFDPSIIKISRGPFISSASIMDKKEYDSVGIDSISYNKIDIELLRLGMNNQILKLPKGIKLRINLTDRDLSPLVLTMSCKAAKLSLIRLSGLGTILSSSGWRRSFAGNTNDNWVVGESYILKLCIGGPSLLRLEKLDKSGWSVTQYLEWFNNLFTWIPTYLDWLETEDEIPDIRAFDLVSSNPAHYKYRLGNIPPGNGHIIYDGT
jgi:hypothetical protein